MLGGVGRQPAGSLHGVRGCQPSDRDVSRNPHLRATLLVEAPLPLDGLPPKAVLSGTRLRFTLSTGEGGIESLYRLP